MVFEAMSTILTTTNKYFSISKTRAGATKLQSLRHDPSQPEEVCSRSRMHVLGPLTLDNFTIVGSAAPSVGNVHGVRLGRIDTSAGFIDVVCAVFIQILGGTVL